MAYVNSTRVVGNGLAERISMWLKSLKIAAQRRAVFERTVQELNALTNRELADLGIARLNIRDVAYAAAYGK